VGSLGDRFAKLDRPIYRADDSEQRVRWGRLWIVKAGASIVVVVALLVLRSLVDEGVAILVLLVASIGFVVGYVVWRRRRNRRLTGSPTTWAEQDR
jgi:Flp pilus assembly protein TadB